jgi:response regulator NasT
MKVPNVEKSMTVVIAEDNATTRRCIKDQLEALGYEVVGAAANGQVAVKMVEELRPSLVILDVKMPKMSGIEAARAITDLDPIPIILVTGLSSDGLAEEAIEAGVFSYLVKPITKKHLLPAIKLAMGRFQEFSGLKDEVKDLKEAIEARKVIEKAKGILMKRCKIDENDAYRLLQTQSQKENRKMREIAEMVVSASKLI